MPEPPLHVALTADPMLPVPPRLYGGIERVIDMLARGLVARGHRVTLVAHRDSATAGRLIAYPSESPSRPLGVLANALTVARLAALRPDVVHSFGRLATLAPLLPLGVPKVMSYQREPTLSQVRLAARLARRGTLAFTGCAEHIAALTRPFAPSVAVFNGVPMDTYTFRAAVAADAPLVFLGRVERIKGAHTAIAVAKAAGCRLVIAGNVPPEAQGYFDAEVAPHLGDAVEYVGPVDDAQKNDLLGRAGAFLMPIEWEEPFGIVMAEALACGTPVVGLRRGSVPEVVRDGVTGFVCGSAAEMAEAVGRLGTIRRAACRADAEARFSDHAVVDAYEHLYRRMLERAFAPGRRSAPVPLPTPASP